MPMAIVVKPIAKRQRGLFDVPEIKRELARVNQNTAKKIKRDFEKTVATWLDKPRFEQITTTGRDMGVTVFTNDAQYHFVNRGTRVRHAVMSTDFKAKTRPGYIGSMAGMGRVVFVSRKINLPGIKARNFTGLIAKKYKRPYEQDILKVLRSAKAKGN